MIVSSEVCCLDGEAGRGRPGKYERLSFSIDVVGLQNADDPRQ